jgi:hypothetical protein
MKQLEVLDQMTPSVSITNPFLNPYFDWSSKIHSSFWIIIQMCAFIYSAHGQVL